MLHRWQNWRTLIIISRFQILSWKVVTGAAQLWYLQYLIRTSITSSRSSWPHGWRLGAALTSPHLVITKSLHHCHPLPHLHPGTAHLIPDWMELLVDKSGKDSLPRKQIEWERMLFTLITKRLQQMCNFTISHWNRSQINLLVNELSYMEQFAIFFKDCSKIWVKIKSALD